MNPEGYTRLSGPEKAAIMMLALNDTYAAKLITLLDLDEVKDLSQSMSLVGRVGSDIVEHVLREFVAKLSNAGSIAGGFETTERLLLKMLDKPKVDEIMAEIRGPAGKTVWDKLSNVNEAVLAAYLKNEYPQTVAVVLSKIEPAHSARVLTSLPEEFGVEVILRMSKMESVQKEIINDVERTLRAEFMSNLARTSRRDNTEVMAEIFNYFDRSTEARLMSSLQDRNRELADRIAALMFTFKDLIRLDNSGIQTLIRNAGNNRIGLALKGAGEDVRELFFKNMSERGAKILKEEMESMGPVKLRDVEEAQQFLVNMAKELAASGEIALADNAEDQMVG